MVFQGVPLFYSPMITFPLANERKSGFLAPTFSLSGRNGPELAAPYYWAIAPNMDYTLTPRMMLKRGLQMGNEFRYLESDYSGEVRAEFLPSDRITNDSRHLFSLRHTHRLGIDPFGGSWVGLLNAQKVSDDFYFRDMSTRIALTSLTNLNQESGITVLMVTHEPDMAAFAHTVIHFKDGLVERIEANDHQRGGAA
jgi:LPS-assembly protein